MTVLTRRALGRAALARQLLLERHDLAVADAVAHLGGLQAQEPQEPYVGLWSRLRAFDPGALVGVLRDRQVVRTHLMRRTVHLVTATDVLAWRSLHEEMLRQRVRGALGARLAGVNLDELAALAAPLLAAEARTLPEVARVVGARWPELAARDLGDALSSALPLVQVPPRGLWGVTAPARTTTLAAWLGRSPDPPSDAALDDLVRRYLAAFGPAATADIRAWSGLAGLSVAVARLREGLVSFRDERGRELLDLPDAPRPDPDTPAPVRFLPAFDNAVLGYDDRRRIIDDAHRGLSVIGARFLLVDGRVAGTWTVQGRAADATVVVTPLVRLTRADRQAVAAEGHDLAGLLSDGTSRRVRVAASPI